MTLVTFPILPQPLESNRYSTTRKGVGMLEKMKRNGRKNRRF